MSVMMNSLPGRLALLLLACWWPRPAGSTGLSVLHSFTPLNGGVNQDGANPAAGLAASSGRLWGTTVNGGIKGAGAAFYLTPAATNLTAFRWFTNAPDGGDPQGELALSGTHLFGTSLGGGSSGAGTLFVAQTNGNLTLVRSFSSVQADTATNSGGASPSGLLASSGATLFGTTTAGGAFANGAAFSVATNGTGFVVLHDFTPLDSAAGTNGDGALPWGGLILAGDTLYGTTSAGGAGGSGSVFSVRTNGGNFSTLHSFSPLDPLNATNTDGAIPLSGLVLSNGVLYGTTFAGGQAGSGTVFSLSTNGAGFSVSHHFSLDDAGTNPDGAAPCAPLAACGGVLYGTACRGGSGGSGTVFCLSTNGAHFQTLYSFSSLDASGRTNLDGALPIAGLLHMDNSLYGTTFSGGPGEAGTVFGLALASVPATITGVFAAPDGSISFSFRGGAGSVNVIQATASLVPPVWQNVATNVADADGEWQFTETNHTMPARFYHSYAP